MRLAAVLAVAAVANGQSGPCSTSGNSNLCEWNNPTVTVPMNGMSGVPVGYRSAKATISNNQWVVFNLDFSAELLRANQMPHFVTGWTQYIGVKVEKGTSGTASAVNFVYNNGPSSAKWDNLYTSGADTFGVENTLPGSLRTEVNYCYPVPLFPPGYQDGSMSWSGWKIAIQAACDGTSACPLGTDWQVTPFTYYGRNAWNGGWGYPSQVEYQRGSTFSSVSAPFGDSGWTWCPQAADYSLSPPVYSNNWLNYENNDFMTNYIWRYPIQTEAFTASFATQLFFQQTNAGDNDDANRWFNQVGTVQRSLIRNSFNTTTTPPSGPGIFGQTVYIQRASSETGLDLFAEVTGSLAALAAVKFQLCFTSITTSLTNGYPGLSREGLKQSPLGYTAINWNGLNNMENRGGVCDLGCYPNPDCSRTGLKVGGLTAADVKINADKFYATVIIPEIVSVQGQTANLFPVGDHKVAFAFGHPPNAAASVGVSAAAALLVVAAAMLS